MIYFVQCGEGGPIKIGVADFVEPRIASLQCASPYPLILLKTQQGDIELERHLHARFKNARIRGEWFAPCQDLLDYISRVNPYRRYTKPFIYTKTNDPRTSWDHFLEELTSNDEARILAAYKWLKEACPTIRVILRKRIQVLGLDLTLDPKPPTPPRRRKRTPEQEAADQKAWREYEIAVRKDRRKYGVLH